MNARRTSLKKEQLAHILRAAAAITNRSTFVIIGTGAAIAQLKHVPLAMMGTREADLYVPEDVEMSALGDLIDGTIGEGSQFDSTYGYYAHGVDDTTAILPEDWRDHAVTAQLPSAEGVTCICPEVHDVAVSKLCAWRQKDQDWILAGLHAGVLDVAKIGNRTTKIDNPRSPPRQEIERRLQALATQVSISPSKPLGVDAARPPARRDATNCGPTDDNGVG